ncbi:MAG: co-chaperone GroES [bacterium]
MSSNETRIKPLGDRIVVKAVDETETTTGGIFIPDSAREKPQRGEVLAVGAGKLLESGKREEMDVKVGDIILFTKYGGTDIKINNKEYKILSVRDVLGIVE